MSSYTDTFVALMFLLLLAIVSVLGIVLTTQIGGLMSSALASEPVAQQAVDQYTDVFPELIQFIFFLVLAAIPIIGFSLGVLVPVSRVWFWLYIAITLPLMFFGVFMQDLWDVFRSTTLISDGLTAVAPMAWVMDHFLVYAGFVFIIIGVGTYVKLSGNELLGGGY
jgi:hypothetical protein